MPPRATTPTIIPTTVLRAELLDVMPCRCRRMIIRSLLLLLWELLLSSSSSKGGHRSGHRSGHRFPGSQRIVLAWRACQIEKIDTSVNHGGGNDFLVFRTGTTLQQMTIHTFFRILKNSTHSSSRKTCWRRKMMHQRRTRGETSRRPVRNHERNHPAGLDSWERPSPRVEVLKTMEGAISWSRNHGTTPSSRGGEKSFPKTSKPTAIV